MVMVMKIANPGNTASHHEEELVLASDSNNPQVMTSAGIKPMKERNASIRIAAAIPKAKAISTGDSGVRDGVT